MVEFPHSVVFENKGNYGQWRSSVPLLILLVTRGGLLDLGSYKNQVTRLVQIFRVLVIHG